MTPNQAQVKRRPGRADGAPRAVSGAADMTAPPPDSLRRSYLTVTFTLVGQPLEITSVAFVIWSSVGRSAPFVSGTLAGAEASTTPRLTMSSKRIGLQ